jgi:hypothetical protein
MGLHDRIKGDAGRALTEFTDADHSRRIYYWIIGAGFVANALSWFVAIVTPDVIADWVGFAADLSDRVKGYLLAIPFWSTFFAVYAALRTRTYSNPTAAVRDEDVMASYRDTERREYLRNRILTALAAAAVNVILLVFVVITLL